MSLKKLIGILIIALLAARLSAQTNVPVRLALIAETDEAAVASDVLTAQLSGNPKIQLLERNEIEKVYREQGLSAANRDYLKLGRILGADGLLLLEVVRTPQTTNLTARLIAVKPGVILTDGIFPWPLTNAVTWAETVAPGFNAFLPKLAVLAKDAIPISVVNLRSAVQSSEAQETERQLKLLTIQRLSQERQFFVLERQRMQLVSEEKELKSDESAFWDGSYLLEGVVDQNGYSKETVTINAHLTPPKGGAPLLFEVSGSRTNLAEVINRLAAKVIELLKVNSSVKEWNADDEAAQYFDEAKWALRWGVLSEAQAAADSAWALGKHDMDCAIVRVKAYEVPPDTGGYENGEYTNPRSTNEVIQAVMAEHKPNQRWGLTWKEQNSGGIKVVQYVSVGKFPDPKKIDPVLHALQLYYAFSQTLPADEPKAGSDWYRLGIEDLTIASQVLQQFQLVPESQKPAAEKLAELRAQARAVAEWISRSPTVHDSYFVGDRRVTYGELAYTIAEQPNLFKCEVTWGGFWQERPEDCLALYRELMNSPVFSYIHMNFWLRKLQTPRLVAWTDNDRRRIPAVWNDFVREVEASTNTLLQLEARALALADADNEKQMAVAFTNFFNSIFENRDALLTNNVEVLYLNWGADELVSAKTMRGIGTDTKQLLNRLFYSEYRPRLEAMRREYRAKTAPAGRSASVFQQQKQYLKDNKTYDFVEFAMLFQTWEYSQSQAREIQPLFIAYKSNLVAQSQLATGSQKNQLMVAIRRVGFLESNVSRILNSPVQPPQSQPAKAQTPPPVVIAKPPAIGPVSTNASEIVTNVLAVRTFLAMPLEGLESDNLSDTTLMAHHGYDGKLVLDFRYRASIYSFDEQGNWKSTRYATLPAIAILDPVTEHWEVIGCPEAEITRQNNFYHRTALLHGELFNCDGGQLRKCDLPNRQWRVLQISDGNNYELFAVNGGLFAANGNVIFEILEGGKSTRILASSRRNPPVSALDREDLGTPMLFEGPNHALRASTRNKIYTWTGNNWREDCPMPSASSQLDIFADGVLFHQPGSLSFLPTRTNVAELCLQQKRPSANNPYVNRPGRSVADPPEPLWKLPPNLFLPNLPAAVCQSDLYLLVDHSERQNIVDESRRLATGFNMLAKDGYHAALLCFSRDLPVPQKLFLKFDAPNARVPLSGINPGYFSFNPMTPSAWMLFATNFLCFGLEAPSSDISVWDAGGGGSRLGVWLMPVSQLDTAIAGQKRVQFATEEKAREETEQYQKAFLTKYDRNHNGILDPGEKQKAMDDPGYVKFMVNVLRAGKARANSGLSPTNEP